VRQFIDEAFEIEYVHRASGGRTPFRHRLCRVQPVSICTTVACPLRAAPPAPWKRQTVQPVTADAWHSVWDRFDLAQRGALTPSGRSVWTHSTRRARLALLEPEAVRAA
jgi:hypothetical protein